MLTQQRVAGFNGVRSAQLTLDLVLAVGPWLRDEQLIAPTAALRWKRLDEEFATDAGEHTPARPRYTREEYRALFTSAWKADERYGLAYALGAEYRIGQLIRAKRSHLDRANGRLTIPGSGKKRGSVVLFTPQQRADVERVLSTGYLAGLEAALLAEEITDYALFPGGHFAHDADGNLVSRAEYARTSIAVRFAAGIGSRRISRTSMGRARRSRTWTAAAPMDRAGSRSMRRKPSQSVVRDCSSMAGGRIRRCRTTSTPMLRRITHGMKPPVCAQRFVERGTANRRNSSQIVAPEATPADTTFAPER
jgi:integrase